MKAYNAVGAEYEGSPGDEQYRITEFDRYAARIETRENIEPERNQKNLTTIQLMANPTKENLAELLWRVGIPVSALVLVLLAIPMSFVNPRAGRSANLLFALLTFMVYSNLLSVSQARVAQGRLDFSTEDVFVNNDGDAGAIQVIALSEASVAF